MIPDPLKNRLLALVLTAIFALLSMGVLCVVGIIALSRQMEPLWASLFVFSMLLLITSVAAFIAFRPDRSAEADMEAAAEHAADEVGQLPVNVVRSAVQDRPMTAVVTACALGFGVGQNPSEAARMAAVMKDLLE
jgi:hypothetical protein